MRDQIKQWIVASDKYHYLLESEEDYITDEILKLVIEFGREAYEEAYECAFNHEEPKYSQWLEQKLR